MKFILLAIIALNNRYYIQTNITVQGKIPYRTVVYMYESVDNKNWWKSTTDSLILNDVEYQTKRWSIIYNKSIKYKLGYKTNKNFKLLAVSHTY